MLEVFLKWEKCHLEFIQCFSDILTFRRDMNQYLDYVRHVLCDSLTYLLCDLVTLF